MDQPLVQSLSWWLGLKQILHLWALLIAPKHSAPGPKCPHGATPLAQAKHKGFPVWSFVLPLPFPFPPWSPLPPVFNFRNSCSSSWIRFLFANLLSLLACVLLFLSPSSVSFWLPSRSLPPGMVFKMAASDAMIGLPLDPAAIQAAAGMCTHSCQYGPSSTNIWKMQLQGFAASQLDGVCLPKLPSAMTCLLKRSSCSARALSSAS